MKNTFGLFLLAAGMVAVSPAFAADTPPAGQVEVIFDKPENFRDIKDSSLDTERGREANLAQFRQYLEQRAPRLLAPGQKLSITISDIDMAGEYEPWRGPSAQDVRIIKSIYTPRIELSYKLTDQAGAVIKEGKSKLSDLNFQNNITSVNTSDELRYEKRLLDDWLRSEFRTAKK